MILDYVGLHWFYFAISFVKFTHTFSSSVAFPIHPSLCLSFASGAISFKFCVVYFLHFKLKIEQPAGELGGMCCGQGKAPGISPGKNYPAVIDAETLGVKGSHWRYSAGDVCPALANRIYGQGTEIDVLQGSPRCDERSIRISRLCCSCSRQCDAISYPKAPIQHPHRCQFRSIVF